MSGSCENEFKYCPICQLPLQTINISPTIHATQCLSTWDESGLEECPEGAKCLSTNIFHYRDYSHMKLAKYRSSSAYVEPQVSVLSSPKKQSRSSPRKRPKMSPTKSSTLILSHKTDPFITSDHVCSSDSDSDFILPPKLAPKDLKYSDSHSSTNNHSKKKKRSVARTTKSVSDSSSVKEKQISTSHKLYRSKSVNSQDILQRSSSVTSDSSEVEALLSEMYSIFSDTSDLLSDDETFYLKDTISDEVISANIVNTKTLNSFEFNSASGKTNFNKSVFNNNLSYVQSTSDASLNDHTHHSKSFTPDNKGTNDKEQWKALLGRMRDRNMPSGLKVDTDDSLALTSSSSSNIGSKECPFYKRIPGTPFVVDAFQYGDIPGIKAYFLSHFHSDHYIGLRKSFSQPIYCSQITANLVRMKIRVEERWLNVLALHQPKVICGIEVTALDANHCPGSLMLLFRLKNGSNYLHVGDFRASTKICSYPELKHITISKLFLDTTYCNPRYVFPTQEEVISKVVTTVRKHMLKHPKLLVVCGSYLIGKEKVFLGIAEALNWKVWVRMDKRKVFECLNDSKINSRLTINGSDARVHVVPMGLINHKWLQEHASQFNVFTHVIGIKPTGWELNLKSDEFRVETHHNCTIYGVAYSEHSSYSELRNFVRFIRPEEIIPTVNVGNPASRGKMKKCFQEWMRSSDGTKQSSVSSYFK